MSSEVWLNGQPPVGCECEFRPSEHTLWAKVKVLAIAGDYFWLDYPDDKLNDEPDTHQKTGYFRPLKTKEQTEREEAINNVCNDLGIMLGTNHDRIDAAIDSMLKLGYHNGPKMGEVVSVPQTRNLWRESDYNAYDIFIAANFTITRKVKS